MSSELDLQPGDVISHAGMSQREGRSLQRGMNYGHGHRSNVFLMSRRNNARYEDEIQDGGRVLIYEGHDEFRRKGGPDPKTIDQPEHLSTGTLTENGLFAVAAQAASKGRAAAELVRVYEKIQKGIWVFNGAFRLVDAWREKSGGRLVFKFRLELPATESEGAAPSRGLPHTRLIPPRVKQHVWERDHGQCVKCGGTSNLHFDHLLPFSLGGSSLVAENIQLLCARHNLQKSDRIE